MTLITQIIIAVITLGIMLMKKYFYKIKEQESKKNNDERNAPVNCINAHF